jgi:hypothetical protein
MQEKYPNVPDSEAFPLDECDQIFFKNAYAIEDDGTIVPWLEKYDHGYYSSTFVWMLAYALWQKETGKVDWDNIDIYGFHASSQSEYMYQKPSAEFWISQAMARDVNVRIVESSPLLQGHLYGYKVSDSLVPSQLEDRIKDLEDGLPGIKDEVSQNHGARLMMDALIKKYGMEGEFEDFDEIRKTRVMEELRSTAQFNFYQSAKISSQEILRQLGIRHEGDEITGWVDRMTLEIQKSKIRHEVTEIRAEMDAISGALQECRFYKNRFKDDPELVASFKLREKKLLNKLVSQANLLSRALGLVSNLSYLIVVAEGRVPNATDEHDFGYIVIPELFDENLDVLTLGDEIDGETGQETTEATDEGGAGSDPELPS